MTRTVVLLLAACVFAFVGCKEKKSSEPVADSKDASKTETKSEQPKNNDKQPSESDAGKNPATAKNENNHSHDGHEHSHDGHDHSHDGHDHSHVADIKEEIKVTPSQSSDPTSLKATGGKGATPASPQANLTKPTEKATDAPTYPGVSIDGAKLVETASGIKIYLLAEGKAKPNLENTITAHYSGYKLNGEKFDSSHDRNEPITSPLRGLIRGWQEGFTHIGKGGKAKLVIPGALAYGEETGKPSRVPLGTLVFDVELLDFK